MTRQNIIRIACVCLLTAPLAAAQDAAAPPALPALEQMVKDRTAEWQKLSQNLQPSLNRLLPCDPKVAASITEVARASDARIAAVEAYLQAANRQAALDVSAAKQVVASAQMLGVDLAAEKSELAPERAGPEGLLANLTQSAQRRASLVAPEDALKQVLAVQQERSDAVDSAIGRADGAAAALIDLIGQLQARQTAWADVQKAFGAEGIRWREYYAARLARAQTECTITRGPAPAGKQK
jgi:hypothetical protein